jgi:hypothetical protein
VLQQCVHKRLQAATNTYEAVFNPWLILTVIADACWCIAAELHPGTELNWQSLTTQQPGLWLLCC